jgi:hypothetical protein
MSLADSLKTLARSIRGIPGTLGIRPYRVHIVLGAWSGTYVGRGVESRTTVEVVEGDGQPPKVRFANDEQIALGGLSKGDVTIGPITTGFDGTATLLAAAVEAHETVHVILTGPKYPTGARFRVREVPTDLAIHWTLRCSPVDLPPE